MLMEDFLVKQLSILIISAVKFMVAAPASYLFGYSYLHTILNTTIGGWIGVLIFYYLGRYIFSHFSFWKQGIRIIYHRFAGVTYKSASQSKQPTEALKIFTRRNRWIIKIRNRFGFPGLIILTPVLLSIPLGTFLVVRYYSYRRGKLAWLSLSVVVWSVILSTFINLF